MKFFLVLLLCISATAADFSTASTELNEELKALNSKLDSKRKTRFAERQKLNRDIAVSESVLEKLAAESGVRSKSADKLLQEIETLQEEISRSDRLFKSVNEALTQSRREFESLIPQQKRSFYSGLFNNFDKTPSVSAMRALTESAIQDGFSIKVNQTEALNSDGVKSEAVMLSFSHALNYLSINNDGGLAVSTPDHLLPSIKAMPGVSEAIGGVESGVTFNLPFDFTDGLAFKKEAAGKTFIEHLKAGGIIIYPLLLLAALCLCAGIYKSLQLYLIRSHYDDKVSVLIKLIQAGDLSEAEKYVDGLKDPIKSLLQDALKHHKESRVNLEEILNETILSQLPRLDRFLPVLSVSAGAAPLLGLLGTVMGIIKTFEMISIYGTGEASRMAGGISEALVTTEAGLIVAIPALIWYAVLNRRLKTIVGSLEKAMLGFINSVSVRKDEGS